MKCPKIDLAKLENLFSRLDIQGVKYGLGAKAGPVSTKPEHISRIDCSGWAWYGLRNAATGPIDFPDGSQNQRAWCEAQAAAGNIKKVDYRDAARYMTEKRLFIAFIKPHTNGCGSVGHVWFLTSYDKDDVADTMESHGGVGINSRPWNTRTLRNQVYSCYELPVA